MLDSAKQTVLHILKQIKLIHNFFLQVNEAYDEVDEQKKDTAQWKNKYKEVQVFINFLLIFLFLNMSLE